MHESPDVEDLVRAARAGEQDAWNALVDRYLPLVTGVIARFRLSRSDADDVNQTVWLRLVEHLSDIREAQALPGWLATTTRHEALRVIRLRDRQTPVDPQGGTLEHLGVSPELTEDLLREERAQALREAMLELSPARQELVMLLLADPPMSYEEISGKLGIPVGSIGPTRARVLEQLRNHPRLRALAETVAVT